jgi:hypothetical protein
VKTWRDLAVFYQAVRALYNRIFGILGLIMVVIVAFAMSNTLGMAVVERTREIGTLRAIGTQPGEVVRNFVLEGAAIGAAGAVIGMLLAGATTLALLFAGIEMPPPPGRSVGYPLLLSFSRRSTLAPRWSWWPRRRPPPGSSAAAPPTNPSRRPWPMFKKPSHAERFVPRRAGIRRLLVGSLRSIVCIGIAASAPAAADAKVCRPCSRRPTPTAWRSIRPRRDRDPQLQGRRSWTRRATTRSISSPATARWCCSAAPAERGQKLLMQGDDFWLMMPASQRPLRITPMQKLLGEASTGDIATMTWGEDYDGACSARKRSPASPASSWN